jgi:hypothetical protein
MVAVGIGSIVALGVSTLFIFAVEQFTILVEQNNTEEEMLWASYHTRSFLSQAIELDVAGAGNPRLTTRSSLDWENGTNMNFLNEGLVVQLYNSTDSFSPSAGGQSSLDLIAVFPRENGYATAAGFPGSQLYSTAIFFQRPTVGLAGKLFFVVGSQTSGAGAIIDPGDDEIVYERLTEFVIMTETVDPGSGPVKAKSAEVTITGRYFRTSDRNRYAWCPLSLVSTNAACQGSAFKDITMTINVGFRNNGLLECADVQTGCVSGSSYRERLHGGLYFFKMAVPPIVY